MKLIWELSFNYSITILVYMAINFFSLSLSFLSFFSYDHSCWVHVDEAQNFKIPCKFKTIQYA
jgi:hypothetical protein